MRGSVRLAALSGLHVIYVWTHDSVGLGEDGPTHQPVEHYAALRAMPNLWFMRPGDANETAAAWRLAIERRDGPVALALTRQKLPIQPGTQKIAADGVRHGGYVLADATDDDGRTGHARPDPAGDRLRASAGDGRPRVCWLTVASEHESCRCPAGSSSPSSRRSTATRCCRPT